MSLKLIYDNYHGNIEFSEFESLLFRNSLINRLHQILQNSTAYLVYPCCKTSRFEHSIGVMNYASHMFQNGINNSDCCIDYIRNKEVLLKKYLNEIEGETIGYIYDSASPVNNRISFKKDIGLKKSSDS
jgi:uncharacterized protein